MKKLYVPLICFLTCPAIAQITFQKVFEKGNQSEASDLISLNDGSSVIVGGFWEEDWGGYSSSHDGLLIGTNANGNVQWAQRYSAGCYLWLSADVFLNSIEKTSDGGFILGGQLSSGDYCTGAPFGDLLLIKTDSMGVTQWSRTYGPHYASCFSIYQTADSGFIAAGYTIYGIDGSQDILLLRINKNGILLWAKTFGGPKTERGNSVIQTDDGGFIVAGNSESFSDTLHDDAYLLKVKPNGNVQWCKTYSTSNFFYVSAVCPTEDHAFVFNGSTSSPYNGFAIKINHTGDILWAKTYADSTNLFSIEPSGDGGFVMTGRNGGYPLLMKTDEDGNVEWANRYSNLHNVSNRSVNETTDNGYISIGLAGWSGVYMLKSDSMGHIGCNDVPLNIAVHIPMVTVNDAIAQTDSFTAMTNVSSNMGGSSATVQDSTMCMTTGIDELQLENIITLSPNPFTTTATIIINQPGNFDFMLYNLFGQQVMRAENISNQYTLERGNLPAGVYFYRIEQESKLVGSAKLIAR